MEAENIVGYGGEKLDRFETAEDLIDHTRVKLLDEPGIGHVYPKNLSADPGASAVLLLLGNHCGNGGFDPCLILNKRSINVRQGGDLCCPGGSVHLRVDRLLARVFSLPGFPLARWPFWRAWRRRYPGQAAGLALMLATSLRESLEEMRLNPMGVNFLGPLPTQHLVMFRKAIFPMAGWIGRQKRYFPNWEVEKIVRIPLQELMNPENYACYRLYFKSARPAGSPGERKDFPCFVHRNASEAELLWGATYRITTAFLDRVFGFRPPAPETLRVINGVLGENYGRNGREKTS